MLKIKHYVKPQSLKEAYELNQARNSRVMGGMMWMRLGNANVQTIIDLSDLGLNQIEETDHVFRIGAMCSLRTLETHQGLKDMFGQAIEESVRHIVGVQFRNQATVGGSIYGRYGFSDVLTCLLALDTFVELYNGGTVHLSDYINKKPDHDIIISIIIRKRKRKIRYASVRQCATDFPVLTCAVVSGLVHDKECWYISVGARPMRAELLEKEWSISSETTEEQIAQYAKEAAEEFTYGSNMRGSDLYRKHLAEVMIKRAIQSMVTEEQ